MRLGKSWRVNKQVLAVLIVFFGIAGLTGCGLFTEEPELDTYDVSGKVLDRQGQGIEGVTLKFSGESESVETDSDGKWSKTGLQGEVKIVPLKEEILVFEPAEYLVTGEETDIVFEEYLNQGDMAEIESAHEEVSSYLADFQAEGAGVIEEKGQDILEEVEAIERVKWAKIEGRDLILKYEGAGEEIWPIETYPEPEEEQMAEVLGAEMKELTDSQKAIKTGNAALVHPLYVREHSDYQTKAVPAMLENVKAGLESVGYEVDILMGEEVDLSFYFDLLYEDYNIIFFNGHGSSTSLMTGEEAPAWGDFCPALIGDDLVRAWAYDRVIRTSNYDYGRFWFITDGFIDKYWFFKEKALFFDWGCSGLYSETGKAESLTDINIEAYIAWDDIKAGAVGSFHKLALKMVGGKSLEEAFDALDEEDKISKGYYEDPQTGEKIFYEGHLDYFPRENGGIRIGGSQSTLSPIDCFFLDLEEAETKQEIEFEYEVEVLDEDNTYFTAEIKPGGDQYYQEIEEPGQYTGLLEFTAPGEKESKNFAISGQLTASPEPLENHDTEKIEFSVKVAPGHDLIMSKKGDGTVTPETGIHRYEKGTEVSLKAKPQEGWEFKKWLGDVQDPQSPETVVVMDEDREITAVFEEREFIYYEVSFENPEKGQIWAEVDGEKISSGSKIEEGANVKFSSEVELGYEIENWIVNGVALEDEDQPDFTYKNLDKDIHVSLELTPAEIDEDDIPGIPLAVGSSVSGEVDEEENPNDVYQIKLQKGEEIRINFEDEGADSRRAFMRLLSPDSGSIEANDFHTVLKQDSSGTGMGYSLDATITYTAPTTDTYYIWIHGDRGNKPYTLEVIETSTDSFDTDGGVDIDEALEIEKDIEYRGVVDSHVAPEDVYAIDLEKGEEIRINFEDKGIDSRRAFMRLLSPDSGSIEANDFHTVLKQDSSGTGMGYSLDATITYTAATTDTYYIWVHGARGNKPYTLEVIETPADSFDTDGGVDIDEALEIEKDIEYRGVVDSHVAPEDVYAIDLEKGEEIRINFEDKGIDSRRAFMRLLSPDSGSIEANDFHTVLKQDSSGTGMGYSLDATITYTAATTDTYYIWVHGARGNKPYTLEVIETPADSFDTDGGVDIDEALEIEKEIEYRGVVDSHVAANDVFAIKLNKGEEIRIRFIDEGKDSRNTWLNLLCPESTSIKSNDLHTILERDSSGTGQSRSLDAQITYEPEATGIYFIWVEGDRGNTPYILDVIKTP